MALSVVKPEHVPIAQHETIPVEVREAAQALHARMDRIRRVLCANSALPATKADAKAQLVALAREALDLWTGIE